jgi:hypothetical protein
MIWRLLREKQLGGHKRSGNIRKRKQEAAAGGAAGTKPTP